MINPITTVPIIPSPIVTNFIQILSSKKCTDIPIISHIRKIDHSLVALSIPFSCLNFAIFGPTYLFFMRRAYNLSELLTYNAAVKSKKGVVGKPGIKMPIVPKKRESVPSVINIIFNMAVLSLQLDYTSGYCSRQSSRGLFSRASTTFRSKFFSD